MVKGEWRIDVSDIEFDFPSQKEEYRKREIVVLVIRTIDEILDVNTDGGLGEFPILYLEIVNQLMGRVKSDLYGILKHNRILPAD